MVHKMADNEIEKISGVGPKAAKTLVDCGFNTIEKLSKTTADELSQLPGIGKATAEKIIANAKELVKSEAPAKAPTKTPAKIPKVEIKADETIPVPKKLEKEQAPVSARPSVKKAPTEPKIDTIKKKAVPKALVSPPVAEATQKAIEQAPPTPKIKPGKSSKKKKKKVLKVKQTYGIIRNVLHGKTVKTINNKVILNLYNTEIPLQNYIGKKVRVQISTEKTITGIITKVHGKSSSKDNAVVVRFPKNISPHIVSAKAEVL